MLLLLLSLKIGGLVIGGVAGLTQLMAPAELSRRYRRGLRFALVIGTLVAIVSELLSARVQSADAALSRERESHLLAEVGRINRPLFPFGISLNYRLPPATPALKSEFDEWRRPFALVPGRSRLVGLDDLPSTSTTRLLLSTRFAAYVTIYGRAKTRQQMFEQPDLEVDTEDLRSEAIYIETLKNNPTSPRVSYEEAVADFLHAREIEFSDAGLRFRDPPTEARKGDFDNGNVSSESDLLGSTVAIEFSPAFYSKRNLIQFDGVTLHLRGERS